MRTVSAALVLVVFVTTAAAGASLTAAAGLGGLVRSGRWAPVVVIVTNPDPQLNGDLVISWGDAIVRRQLAFDSPGTKRVELYVRSSNVETQMRILLESGGRELASTAVPVRVVGDEDHFRLCVADDPGAGSADLSCTVSVRPATLPASPRGYEAADSVGWPGGRRGMGTAQAAALAQWETLKRLDVRGDLSLTPQAARPQVARGLPSATSRALVGTATTYVVGLLALGHLGRRHRWRLSRMAAAAIVAIGLGCGAVASLGRIGTASAVTVHHHSVVQQIPGAGAALLSMRAVAEFPARGSIALRLPAMDGVIESSVPQGRADELHDADGFPILRGDVGLGSRRAFGAEAVVEASLLAIDDSLAKAVRITNVSPHMMESCRLADGVTPPAVAGLPPGGVIEAAMPADGGQGLLGPLVLCTTTAAAAALTDERGPVAMRGSTVVAAYLDRPVAPAGPGVP